MTINRRIAQRRQIERRAGIRGVTVRHDDKHPESVKRIRLGQYLKDKEKK